MENLWQYYISSTPWAFDRDPKKVGISKENTNGIVTHLTSYVLLCLPSSRTCINAPAPHRMLSHYTLTIHSELGKSGAIFLDKERRRKMALSKMEHGQRGG